MLHGLLFFCYVVYIFTYVHTTILCDDSDGWSCKHTLIEVDAENVATLEIRSQKLFVEKFEEGKKFSCWQEIRFLCLENDYPHR